MPKLDCEGWYDYEGSFREPMHDLVLEYVGGELSGTGHDNIGPFTLSGRIEGDRIEFRKQYLGAHLVVYQGTATGEGLYGGRWKINGIYGGNWCIHVRSARGDAGDQITTLNPK